MWKGTATVANGMRATQKIKIEPLYGGPIHLRTNNQNNLREFLKLAHGDIIHNI